MCKKIVSSFFDLKMKLNSQLQLLVLSNSIVLEY